MRVVGTLVFLLCVVSPAHAQPGAVPLPVLPEDLLYQGGTALRVQVTPRDAEVFLDGYLVGNVDDFDGFFQRLRTRPGEHEIELYKEGYHSVRQKIFLSVGGTFRVHYEMQPVKAGETSDPRPVARTPPERPAPGPGRRERDGGRHQTASFGSIAIRVQPDDAEVFIDGEKWEAAGGDRLVVQTPAGRRHVEVRKAGLRTFSQDVEVRPGEMVTLNVSLQ